MSMKNIFYLLSLSTAILFMAVDGFSQVIQGTYAIKNVETGMLLRIKDANKKDGTPLVSYAPTNWKCMTWDFKHVEGKSYQLRNLFTNKTFQPQKTTVSDGVALEQQSMSTSEINQQWEFIPVSAKTFLIKLKDSDLYITPSDKEGSVNSQIILTKKMASKLQYWAIYEQDPQF